MPTSGGEEQMLIDSALGGHVFDTARRLYYNRHWTGKKCQIVAFDLPAGRTKVLAVTDRPIVIGLPSATMSGPSTSLR